MLPPVPEPPNVILTTGSPRLPLHNCDFAANEKITANSKSNNRRHKKRKTRKPGNNAI